ncbi:hypothetical protein C0J52_10871 [Blattella germanica]|nr:hypothetical protein C0J52_10871 [Blattella germanica]
MSSSRVKAKLDFLKNPTTMISLYPHRNLSRSHCSLNSLIKEYASICVSHIVSLFQIRKNLAEFFIGVNNQKPSRGSHLLRVLFSHPPESIGYLCAFHRFHDREERPLLRSSRILNVVSLSDESSSFALSVSAQFLGNHGENSLMWTGTSRHTFTVRPHKPSSPILRN